MNLAVEIVLATVICAVVFGLLWLARGTMLTPLITGKDLALTVTVEVTGDGRNLQQVVEGLLWLRDSGNSNMVIIIDGTNATGPARKRAMIVANKHKEIGLCGFGADGGEWKETEHSNM